MISRFSVTLASGTNTFYTTEKQLTGRIHAIKYTFGTMEATLDLTITGETTGVPILSYTDVPAANAFWYPREFAQIAGTGALETDNGYVDIHIIEERIKIVTAQGGSSKAGTIEFWIDDGK